MNNDKFKFIKAFFIFSKQERFMSLVMIATILLIITYSFIDRYYFPGTWPEYQHSSIIEDRVDSITRKFHFNPNEVSIAEMQSLGFSNKLAERISNYRAKGGKFYKAEDLFKIWGIDSQLALELIPFVQIPSENQGSNKKKTTSNTKFNPKDYGDWEVFGQSGTTKVELNTASAEDFSKLWGVKEKLATKLVTYREQLGGFVHPNQLKEVFGIDSLFFQKNEYRIMLNESNIRKIHLNEVDKETLQKHPYISWRMAENIVNYRTHHGKYKSIEDLEKILSLKKEDIERIKPYLSFE
jgi:competence protein ComEA